MIIIKYLTIHCSPGSVIRIGVNELHINSPIFFQEMTKVGSGFSKEPNFYRGISFPSSSIGLIDPKIHRIRRQVLGPIFTASRVQAIAPKIQNKIEHLCRKLDELSAKDAPINLYAAFKSLTMDIVSEMVFGESFHVMDSPMFKHPHLDALQDAVKKAWVFRTFPKLGWLSLNLPDALSSRLFPVPIIEFGKVRHVSVIMLQYLKLAERLCAKDLSKAYRPLPGIEVPVRRIHAF